MLIVLLLVLLQGALSEERTEAEIDFVESLGQASLPLL